MIIKFSQWSCVSFFLEVYGIFQRESLSIVNDFIYGLLLNYDYNFKKFLLFAYFWGRVHTIMNFWTGKKQKNFTVFKYTECFIRKPISLVYNWKFWVSNKNYLRHSIRRKKLYKNGVSLFRSVERQRRYEEGFQNEIYIKNFLYLKNWKNFKNFLNNI